ncbi:squalene/phytoene synthase family protein [Palleronia sp. LCG004]|uniref:squalene/phytoene synthase family protein n=1 Tax=Palleronia sp. LCG004 TaxID=3079304 RepID=UPI0029422A75|nr:squalene/phytoene synthase family protein [Palleronia sp. LCG004]WOI57748.1 squalene/phytoene synthase family protein [Palleronia sp. LCG004]
MTHTSRGNEAAHLDSRQIVAASGSSFVHGMRILPAERRAAIYAIYAFCRIVDDIVDAPRPPAEKASALAFWEDELDAMAAGRPRTPLGQELSDAIDRFDLPPEELSLILDGMRMDIHPIVAPDDATLDRYVRRVAGTVGLLSMRIFGAWRGAPSERFALSLAEALQLTNILRDVEEDAALGRIYLPRETLDRAGVPADPDLIAVAPGLPRARAALGVRARAAFGQAAREVPAHDRLRIVPALLMMGPYERLLRRMEGHWTVPAPSPGWRKAVDGIACVLSGGSGLR